MRVVQLQYRVLSCVVIECGAGAGAVGVVTQVRGGRDVM